MFWESCKAGAGYNRKRGITERSYFMANETEYDKYEGPFIPGLSPDDKSDNPLHPENEIDV